MMPTFDNLESLASVRAKINDGVQNAESALNRLDIVEPAITNHETRIRDLESAGPGGSVTVQDEGSTLTTSVSVINFTGAGVTATGAGTVTVDIPGGGGGVTDGDKGDVVVSGGGTVWSLDATTAANLRDRATHTGTQSFSTVTGTKAQLNTAVSDGDVMYVGDAPTAHTHTLANVSDVTMTVANLNSLDDGVNSTLHFHNTDRDRANHTGTQLSTTVSDFNEAAQDAVGGMVDTSLVYNDATPSLQRAALTGAVTAAAGSNTTALGSFTKAQLNTAISDGDAMYVGDAPTAHTHTLANVTDVTMTVANLNSLDDGVNSALHFHNTDRDRANHTGTQTASTISDFSEAVDDRIAALVVQGTNMTITYNDAANTLTFDAAGGGAGTNLNYTASTRILTSDTGTDVTLPLVTSGDAGLAPASGGGTTNFLRADGTWAAPSGGGGGGAPQIMSWMI